MNLAKNEDGLKASLPLLFRHCPPSRKTADQESVHRRLLATSRHGGTARGFCCVSAPNKPTSTPRFIRTDEAQGKHPLVAGLGPSGTKKDLQRSLES